MTEVFSLYPLSWTGLFFALICGTMFGLERQILGKPVGIRTSILIIFSVYIFMGIATHIYVDHVKIIGQIITGVGFLGGGVIIAKEGMIQGMTSAATIWVLTAIGVLIGLGHTVLGVKVACIISIILLFLSYIERKFPFLRRGRHKPTPLDGEII